jgi:adenylate cyclase
MTRPTLTQVFAGAIGAVALVAAILFYGLLESSRRSVVERADRFREAAAQRISARITHDLDEAAEVVEDVERAIHVEAIDAHTPESAEAPLFALILDHPNIADISLTHPDRWQVSVFREHADAKSGIATRITRREADGFVARVRTRAPGAKLGEGSVASEAGTDPTAHLTYATTASPDFYGATLWSDLAYSELDHALPQTQRRVVVTVQKAVDGAHGGPAGVVRVGLLANTVDAIASTRVEEGNDADPHRVFLCDAEGRLLTRLAPGDPLVASGDDLRVAPAHVPPEVARALASPALRQIDDDHPAASEAFDVGGRRYLLTLRAIEDTQGWIAAILVPEDHYTSDLRALRDRFILIGVVAGVCALLAGTLILGGVRAGFRRMLHSTARMRELEFAADPRSSRLRDVDEVLGSLERAKTAMRALGKYVPIDLVRELYASNREPALGGELRELTVMFTDLRGFTDLSEQITPDALAHALGFYLEAMTEAIRATGGTIDKFIGDSVMAIWNAPSLLPDHAKQACRAALACEEATAKLYASEAWSHLPPLVTRFGLHTDRVMVGHFGAPARISYTALGDGVNLASRLEGLGKQYGVTRIASDAVEGLARDAFVFRKLDRVAVKGKSQAVLVFELLGAAGFARSAAVVAYEAALDDYFARRFAEAIARLEPFVTGDPPSEILVERCRAFVIDPPPADWNGAWVAHSK